MAQVVKSTCSSYRRPEFIQFPETTRSWSQLPITPVIPFSGLLKHMHILGTYTHVHTQAHMHTYTERAKERSFKNNPFRIFLTIKTMTAGVPSSVQVTLKMLYMCCVAQVLHVWIDYYNTSKLKSVTERIKVNASM